MVDRIKDRTEYTYRCKHCGWENFKVKSPHSSVPVTKQGSYGDQGTPSSTVFSVEMIEASTIRFYAASGSDPAKLSDSAMMFADSHFKPSMRIRISSISGTNDGDYTIAARGVSRGEILLDSSDSLTDEDAATAGTVTISCLLDAPSVTEGCPLCGSLSSK